MKCVGYITSDPLKSGFIPHSVQNLSIKNFLFKKQCEFILSWTEYKNHSQLAFRSLCQEDYYDGICFYSLEQLADMPASRYTLQRLVERRKVIGFAREGVWLTSMDEWQSFLEDFTLNQLILRCTTFSGWLNEREKYL